MRETVREAVVERASGPGVNVRTRDDVIAAISAEEEVLARLEREGKEARARLSALRAELASIAAEPGIRVHLPVVTNPEVPSNNADKVKLSGSCSADARTSFRSAS